SRNMQAQIQLLQGWLSIMLWKNSEGVEKIWEAIQKLDNPPQWLGMALIPAVNHPELFGERYPVLIDMIRELLESSDDTWQRGWLLKAIGEYDFVARRYDLAAIALQASADCFQEVGDDWAT